MLSKACQYAIKALIYMGTKVDDDDRLTVTEVAKTIGSPPAFTAKILQKLVNAGLITSTKGGGGGFSFPRDAMKKTSILDVTKVVECDTISDGCILGLPNCSDQNPCPVHERYAPLRQKLREDLLDITISKIIQDREPCHFKYK